MKLISDLRMFLLIPLLLFVHGAHCGHFLFWLPMRFDNIKHLNFFKFVRFFIFSAKSVKIAAIEPGLALAEKGHQVTIVCPIRAKKEVRTFPESESFLHFKKRGVHEIVNPSDLDVLQNAISEKQLVEKAEMPFLTFIEVKFKIWIQNRISICFQVKVAKQNLIVICFQVSMTNNRYALEMQEVKELLKDEVRLNSNF